MGAKADWNNIIYTYPKQYDEKVLFNTSVSMFISYTQKRLLSTALLPNNEISVGFHSFIRNGMVFSERRKGILLTTTNNKTWKVR